MSQKAKHIETIDTLLSKIQHEMLDEIQALRKIILDAHPNIEEQVKWNSPAFFFTGEIDNYDPKTYLKDLLVLHLRKPNQILMVFPNGALIDPPNEVLEGNYKDGRRMISIVKGEDLNKKSQAIQQCIHTLIQKIN
jgi:hypothetical protein